MTNGPGKFEGEPAYVPHFWDATLQGHGETFYDGETPVSRFDIEPQDSETWPDLTVGHVLLLWEDSQGFVNSRLCTGAEADQIQAECKANHPGQPDDVIY